MRLELTGAAYIVNLIAKIFQERSLRPLLDPQKLRNEGFSRFWLAVSPSAEAHDSTQALGGPFAPLPGMLGSADGHVLEIGPGSGTFFQFLDAAKIKSMYGVEPTEELHEALRASADAVGLKTKFFILPCGAQTDSLLPALSKAGLLDTRNNGEEGMFDTIISVRSLCSVPSPEDSIKTLYRLLRPGGRFLILEHVVNPWPAGGSLAGRAFQLLYTALGWTYFVGDCELSRDTIALLSKAAEADGGWQSVKLQRDHDWAAIPFVTGTFVKK
ncbi:hypothetical protein MBLNU459_g0210t1 [Dothideomycetes sp. NU459]